MIKWYENKYNQIERCSKVLLSFIKRLAKEMLSPYALKHKILFNCWFTLRSSVVL